MNIRPHLLAVASLALHLDGVAAMQDQKVTFKARAARAERLLKELGAKAGVPLSATATTADDVLLISVKDVPFQQLLDKIAAVENATWIKEGEGYRLDRTAEQRRADEASELKLLADRYKEALAKLATQAEALKSFTDATARGLVQRVEEVNNRAGERFDSAGYNQVQNQSPSGRLLTRLASHLPAEVLASIPDNGRLVFSDAPNRMQRKLPGNSALDLSLFAKEQQMLSAAVPSNAEFRGGFFDLRTYAAPVTSPPAKVLLAVTRPPFQGNLRVSLEILDAKYHVLGTSATDIGTSPFEAIFPGKPDPKRQDEKAIALSEDAKAIRAAAVRLEGRGSDTKGPQLSPELKKKVADPFTYEPLGFVPGEVIVGMGEAKGEQVVATLPDMAMFLLFPMGEDIKPSFATKLINASETEVTEAEGWLLAKPRMPKTCRAGRVDRRALATLLSKCIGIGTVTLDDAAAYAISCPGLKFDILGLIATTLLESNAAALFQQNSMDTLRFYGAMSPVQRQIVKQNRPVPFTTLTSAQGDALANMTFGADSRISASRTMSIEEAKTPVIPSNDPTELLPNGIPSTGHFTLNITSQNVVVPHRENGPMFDNGMTPDELAWRIHSQEHPDPGNSWASDPRNQVDLNALSLSTRVRYNFNFELIDGLSFEQTLNQMTPLQKQVAFKDLPADFRKSYEAAVENYKKMQVGSPVPATGGGSPPPPR